MKSVLLLHIGTTLVLVGLIWTIQVVHYPLFNRVGSAAFPAYESAHMQAITTLVAPLMLVELVTGVALALLPLSQVNSGILWLNLAGIALIWLVTALVNVPQHVALATEFNEQIHSALVMANWVRTLLWTARGLLILGVVYALMPHF